MTETTIVTGARELAGLRVDDLARVALRDATLTGNARVYASPYLNALTMCETLADSYGVDSADMLARYALSNLTGWRGAAAKAWKAEVNARLKACR
jgi:hypothetical protein